MTSTARLATAALTAIAAVSFATVPAHATGPASYELDREVPAMNEASYWNDLLSTDAYTASCTKHENHGGLIAAKYDAAVISDGVKVRVYPDLTDTGAFTAVGATNPANGKPYGAPHSHVMKCTFTTEPPTTTSTSTTSTTTTTEPPTTTTTEPCTTGVIGETGECEPVGTPNTEPSTTLPLPDRTPVSVPPPDLGRCIDGITEFGFVRCETPTTAPASVERLPVTGLAGQTGQWAVLFIALGGVAALVSRRRTV